MNAVDFAGASPTAGVGIQPSRFDFLLSTISRDRLCIYFVCLAICNQSDYSMSDPAYLFNGHVWSMRLHIFGITKSEPQTLTKRLTRNVPDLGFGNNDFANSKTQCRKVLLTLHNMETSRQVHAPGASLFLYTHLK